MAIERIKKYNITGAYNYLLSADHNNIADNTHILWHNLIRRRVLQTNVRLFAWRLLPNRIPATYNLIRRRVLQTNVQLCMGGCGSSISHLWVFQKNLVCYF